MFVVSLVSVEYDIWIIDVCILSNSGINYMCEKKPRTAWIGKIRTETGHILKQGKHHDTGCAFQIVQATEKSWQTLRYYCKLCYSQLEGEIYL